MQQPELGRKIAELRKAKGLTQEELVDKCNLNVRTLQRIESGEVMPRSYTLKVIFVALDYRFYDSLENNRKRILNRFFRNVMDVFNLKKETMKKVSILSTSLLIVLLGAFMINFIGSSKDEASFRRYIEAQNRSSIKWFNAGEIDKLIEDYAPDACFYRNGHPSYCGKEEISLAMQMAVSAKAFKLTDIQVVSLKVNGDLAMEKSLTTSKLQSGEIIKTINLQHWQKLEGRWFIVTDIDVLIGE